MKDKQFAALGYKKKKGHKDLDEKVLHPWQKLLLK